MKRYLFLLSCVLSAFFSYAQDWHNTIEVEVNSNAPVVQEFGSYRLNVMAMRANDSEVVLSIEMENNDAYDILLFGRAYPEKELKKMKIRFDKKLYGTTSRDIQTCEGLKGDDILRVEANMSRTLAFPSRSDESAMCTLPLYIVKNKNRKRYFIVGRVMCTLNVKFMEDEPDQTVYEAIKQKCDALIEEISNVEICTNAKHPESVDIQEQPYLERKNSLVDEIEDIKNRNRWRERDKAYLPYKELLARLENIEFPIKDCRQCKKRTSTPTPDGRHHCNYCEQSPETVYKTMGSIYKKLDQKSITLQEAKKQAGVVYKALNGGCPNLKKKVNGNNGLKNKINSYYQSIIGYDKL